MLSSSYPSVHPSIHPSFHPSIHSSLPLCRCLYSYLLLLSACMFLYHLFLSLSTCIPSPFQTNSPCNPTGSRAILFVSWNLSIAVANPMSISRYLISSPIWSALTLSLSIAISVYPFETRLLASSVIQSKGIAWFLNLSSHLNPSSLISI